MKAFQCLSDSIAGCTLQHGGKIAGRHLKWIRQSPLCQLIPLADVGPGILERIDDISRPVDQEKITAGSKKLQQQTFLPPPESDLDDPLSWQDPDTGDLPSHQFFHHPGGIIAAPAVIQVQDIRKLPVAAQLEHAGLLPGPAQRNHPFIFALGITVGDDRAA